MDYYSQAIDQLIAFGLRADTLDTSGKLVRVPVEGDKGRKKSGWYVAHAFNLMNGRTVIVGRFGNWKLSGDVRSFEADFKFSPEDERALQAKQAADKKHVEVERKRAAADAEKRAAELWDKAHDTGNSDYLKRKGVRGYWVGYLRDMLLVPVRTVAGNLAGLQIIMPDGSKRFITGTAKTGAFHVIGDCEDATDVIIAEGYATAASLYEATDMPCIVAFDAGNLLPVAKAWHKHYPKQRIIIAADDDHATDGNPGITKGRAAASAVGGVLITPKFKDLHGRTDFNDMHSEQGLENVREHVLSLLSDIEHSSGNNQPQQQEPDGIINPSTELTLEQVLLNFYIVYGQGALIFDSRRRIFMSVSDFRIVVGNKVANDYLNSTSRKVIRKENVIFAPGVDNLPPGYINTFHGLPLTPKKGECGLLLDLLFHLCEQNEDVFDWLLKWIAYPLQNLGAKMTTAVVIHGREGAGKNLFWSAIQRIYGDYTSIITQNDLESSFNGWASRKLFIVGNEVVSRQEMFHKKGPMKNMITEPEWNINEKNINHRKEANHANFIFFSNFLQPVTPDKDDRRYLVLWTPQKKEKEYYKKAAQQRDNGGTEALYHYLLNYDVGDFDEYTEPLMTDAKMDLVQLSMRSDERFIENWLLGDLPLPVAPVLTTELYAAYQFWSRKNGEKFAVSLTEFGTLISKHETVSKKTHQWYMKGSAKVRGTFAIPYGSAPDLGDSGIEWLGKSNSEFSISFKGWQESS